ncbi:uncharacterized protein LOC131022061 [Salvia miltiorrhiza]|uniref:uncharacterized protein LOC131022061 n=1 Tax=Salvia miltiorrhiza TaxID=226208 RepID=UPI0025AB946F|nr:uncharacterized protein LOC131022061 [Salvia miltiorrhiza]
MLAKYSVLGHAHQPLHDKDLDHFMIAVLLDCPSMEIKRSRRLMLCVSRLLMGAGAATTAAAAAAVLVLFCISNLRVSRLLMGRTCRLLIKLMLIHLSLVALILTCTLLSHMFYP